jgi:transposase
MFIRKKKSPHSKKTAVQLVKNERRDGKVKQTIVRHFGAAETEEDLQILMDLALRLKIDMETESQPSLFDTETTMDQIRSTRPKTEDEPLNVDLRHLVEEERVKVGIHQIFGHIFEKIGFQKVIHDSYRKKKSLKLMRDIVMTRIDRPQSKLSSVATLKKSYGIKTHINSIYRMMDLLDDAAIERIQQSCYDYTFGLLGEKLDVIFYDCTTLYFESFIEDDLKRNGYSKDGKFNQAQVLLALMVTREGLPIGYEVFPGATFEGHTLTNALEKLHQKYKIDKLVFVADSAMLSQENITLLESMGQPYIVAARLKNLPKKLTKKILDKSQYKVLETQDDKAEIPITYMETFLDCETKKLIVTHNPKRAAKDEHDRLKAIVQLKKRLGKSSNPKILLNNYGYKKYLTIKGETELSINDEKIAQASAWDGLHGIITNIQNAPPHELLSHYHGLWQVEETFRISKHNLRMRPIFHWTPSRIKSHIAICFMALTCIRTLEFMVKVQYKKLSPEVIRKALSELETSVLHDTSTDRHYVLPSKCSLDAKKIYQILGLRWQSTPYRLN